MPNTTLFSLLALQLHPIFNPVHLRELIQIKSLGFIPRKDYLSWMYCLFVLHSFLNLFQKLLKYISRTIQENNQLPDYVILRIIIVKTI